MGLARADRLRHYRDFQAVYRQGSRWTGSILILQGRYMGQGPTRWGIVVGLKVSKKAVVRNRLKRQIRAGLRGLIPRVAPGWQVIILLKPRAVSCDFQQFLQELKELLARAGILHGDS